MPPSHVVNFFLFSLIENCVIALRSELEIKGRIDALQSAPSLPSLPTAPTASMAVQSRLERIWAILDMPVVRRLDMVLQYTHKDRVLKFDKGLTTWEKAAATIQLRESLFSQYATVQQVCIQYTGI